jgi:hypothetical protein
MRVHCGKSSPKTGQYPQMNTASRLLQLFGLACLGVVVLTHVAERLRIFPSMGWGLPDSPGHYLDFASAILGCALLVIGFALRVAGRRKRGHS